MRIFAFWSTVYIALDRNRRYYDLEYSSYNNGFLIDK
jgi:hypothetical protein